MLGITVSLICVTTFTGNTFLRYHVFLFCRESINFHFSCLPYFHKTLGWFTAHASVDWFSECVGKNPTIPATGVQCVVTTPGHTLDKILVSIVVVSGIIRQQQSQPRHEKNLFMPYGNNKGADQPAHQGSLICAFIFCCTDSIIPLVCISEISSLYLASVAVHVGLCLTWSQTPKTGFVMMRLK